MTVRNNSEKKPRKPGEAFERELAVGRNTLKLSSEDPALMACAAAVGYDAAKISQGQAYFDALNEAYTAQKTAYTEQLNAHKVFMELKAVSRKKTSHVLQALRLVLRDEPGTLEQLKSRALKNGSYGAWAEANLYFYKKLQGNPGLIEKLAAVGISQEMIDAANQAFTDTLNAETAHKNARAEAQRATAAKNEARTVFSRWMRRYRNVLSAALVDDPQMREKLGIVAR